jgi:hypothetical protein
MSHPYIGLPDDQFWTKAMTQPAPGQVDPCRPQLQRISRSDKIMTMGSCFAQHLAKKIKRAGFNYLTTEPPPVDLSSEAAARRNYGLFSARYGNIYTARQAVQLFDRAFGKFTPQESVWPKKSRFVDPFRPNIEPDGFESSNELMADSANHLSAVKEAFLKVDWLIFTLGLTEAWQSTADGAVYPIAPGVAGGQFVEGQFKLANFSAAEVADDITALRHRLHAVNPNAKIILTVSPVPLAATASNQNVWVATTYSKAVLRVAAEETVLRFNNVTYFPSYEVIVSPAAGGRYFEDDLRSVNNAGVNHVMRIFFRHFCEESDNILSLTAAKLKNIEHGLAQDMEILCDEKLILSAPSVVQQLPEDFDEARYLDLHPDVAKAVAAGRLKSGQQHYEKHGRDEARRLR